MARKVFINSWYFSIYNWLAFQSWFLKNSDAICFFSIEIQSWKIVDFDNSFSLFNNLLSLILKFDPPIIIPFVTLTYCSNDRDFFLKFKAEDENLQNFLHHQNNFSNSERSEQFLVTECFFKLVPGGFSYLINWKKILGFGNMQEKLENLMCSPRLHFSYENQTGDNFI